MSQAGKPHSDLAQTVEAAWEDRANISTASVLTSLDRLEPLAADVVLCGHGDPFNASPADAVAVARSAGQS